MMRIKKDFDVKVDFTFAELFLMALCWYGWAEFGWHIAFPVIATAYIGVKLIFVIIVLICMAVKKE